jgi:hypothetical protein
MLANDQIRPIQEWENINPRLIWHRWRMSGIGRTHFQNLVEQNPGALVSYCPTDTELQNWTSFAQSKILEYALLKHFDEPPAKSRIVTLLTFQPLRVRMGLHDLDRTMDDVEQLQLLEQGLPSGKFDTTLAFSNGNRQQREVLIDCGLLAANSLQELLQSNRQFTSKPDYGRAVLCAVVDISMEQHDDTNLPYVSDIADFASATIDLGHDLSPHIKGWLKELAITCKSSPAIALPIAHIFATNNSNHSATFTTSYISVDNITAVLGDWKKKAVLLEQAKGKLAPGSCVPVQSTFSPEGCEFSVQMQKIHPVLETYVDEFALLREIEHPLARCFPLAHGDTGYVETEHWPDSEFAFLSPDLRGPIPFEQKMCRQQMLLKYLARRVAKDIQPEPQGRRFVEPGSGRTCLVDFLYISGEPNFVDFSVTGVGTTQYSSGGFVDIGRAADGQAALARAEHRRQCEERLDEAGCRVARTVAIVRLPGLKIAMPDGQSSESALIVRGFRCVLRVKQLDPLASFYHSVQHEPLVASFLSHNQLLPPEQSKLSSLNYGIERQLEAYSGNVFYAAADDPRGLYSNIGATNLSDAARSLRLSAVDMYAPLLLEVAKTRLAAELERDVEKNPVSDDEYLHWFASSMGSQLGRFRLLRFLHDHHHQGTSRYAPDVVYTLVESNVTLMAEFPDLDTGIFLNQEDSCTLDRIQLSRKDFGILKGEFERFHQRDLKATASIVATLAAVVSHGDHATITRAQAEYYRSYEEFISTELG